MTATVHSERHFTAGEVVRDLVIGMSDGLTVPFALAAGLSGAVATSNLVVTAGVAEIAAGSIAMGLGGYLAAKSDQEHYVSERMREQQEINDLPEAEAKEVTEIFQSFGLSFEESGSVVMALQRHPQTWVDFMMRFELGLVKPEPKRAVISALTISGGYISGGFFPLGPYIFISEAKTALLFSVGLTLVALFIFGYIKGRFTGTAPLRSGLQTLVIGGLAAAAAFTIARLIS